VAHPFRDVAPGLSACVSSVQVEKGHPSWQYPHGTKSHDAQLPAPDPDGRQNGGISPLFRTPSTVAHPFRWVKVCLLPKRRRLSPAVLASSSSALYVQSDAGHPTWQYPHGTKSQDTQPPPISLVTLIVTSLTEFVRPGSSVESADDIALSSPSVTVDEPADGLLV